MFPANQNEDDDGEDFSLARRMAEAVDEYPEEEHFSAIANVLALVLTRSGQDRAEIIRSCDDVIAEALAVYDTNRAIRKAN